MTYPQAIRARKDDIHTGTEDPDLEALLVLALYESSSDQAQTPALDDLRNQVEAARVCGANVIAIPPDFRDDLPIEDAFAFIRHQARNERAIWIGGIPSVDHYRKLYAALKTRNIQLINDPGEFERAMFLDVSYPMLEDLTLETEAVRDTSELERALSKMPGPVVLRAGVPRSKGRDWTMCVAENHEVAREMAKSLLARYADERRAALLVRAWQPIKEDPKAGNGRPVTREFRVFLFNGHVLEIGSYWSRDCEVTRLDDEQRREVAELAIEAQKRLHVPYLAVDVAQFQTGEWKVIETWDAQFASARTTSRNTLWNKLLRVLSRAARARI